MFDKSEWYTVKSINARYVRKQNIKKLLTSFAIALILTGITYLSGIYFNWITELNWIEIAAVFTSYSCTYLCVVQTRWNYIVGAISVTLLSIVFFQLGLYSSMALNIYLLPTLIYGWYRWKADIDTRPVTYIDWKKYGWIYVLLTAVTYGLVIWVTSIFGATLPILDSAILCLSILAQFMLDNKKLENWIVWSIVNVISIWLYFSTGAFFLGVQFVFFLLNSFYGFYKWKISIK